MEGFPKLDLRTWSHRCSLKESGRYHEKDHLVRNVCSYRVCRGNDDHRADKLDVSTTDSAAIKPDTSDGAAASKPDATGASGELGPPHHGDRMSPAGTSEPDRHEWNG